MKILAVDNEKIQLKVLEKAILNAIPDADLKTFNIPMQALDWAKENQIDVAFLDIEMPVMNGVVLGKELKKINPKINLIFVTGYYQEYVAEAVPLHFSGYLEKPATAEAVLTELENLRYPIENSRHKNKLQVKCFGNFDVLYNGLPLEFDRSKTKELFAYLVDRKGATVNGNQICAVLYEDDTNEKNNKSDLRKCVADLRSTLNKIGKEEVFNKGFDSYSINVEELECDFYDWEKNEPYAIREFHGEYMNQYYWGEYTLGDLFTTSAKTKEELNNLREKVNVLSRKVEELEK